MLKVPTLTIYLSQEKWGRVKTQALDVVKVPEIGEFLKKANCQLCLARSLQGIESDSIEIHQEFFKLDEMRDWDLSFNLSDSIARHYGATHMLLVLDGLEINRAVGDSVGLFFERMIEGKE